MRARARCHRRCEGVVRAIDVSRRLATSIVGHRLENGLFLDAHLEGNTWRYPVYRSEDFVVLIAADGLRPSGVPIDTRSDSGGILARIYDVWSVVRDTEEESLAIHSEDRYGNGYT